MSTFFRQLRVAAAALICFAAATASATTYTVTTSADSGAGSLRQAITDANTAGGTNTIAFAIPGIAPHTITLASMLPAISGTLTIDGYSQPGSVKNTHAPDQGGLDTVLAIEVSGGGAVAPGLYTASGVVTLTVQGLAMNRFSGDAISGNGGGPTTSQLNVYGNFIGTSVEGAALGPLGNNGTAIRSGFTPAQIGGTQPWQRNLLSGNGGAGALIGGPAVVEGNLIGTDASGTLAIPNGVANNWGGIILGTRSHVRIGGSSVLSRNLISGNHPLGIGIWGAFGASGVSTGFELKGNFIGSDWSGLHPVPNGWPNYSAAQYGGGIQVQNGSTDPSVLVIGGFATGEGNLIVFNKGAGIRSSGNSIGEGFDSRANEVHHNIGVGHANLDIGASGPTPNDPDDADTGANGVQNWPEFLSASQSGNQLTVTYRVDTAIANATYPLRIDFHADAVGGGGTWLTQDSYPLASAQQSRTITLLVPAGVRAIPFAATATDADGHTSEFSPPFDVIFEDGFE
ncbi:MAG: hypothetical protein ABIW82_10360 [Dokdonella sp.]